MMMFLITEAIEVLLALGRVSYNGVIGLYNWYFKKDSRVSIPKTKVSIMLKNFKL